jgi:hypothetical protein
MAEVVEYLISKCKALNSNPSIPRKKSYLRSLWGKDISHQVRIWDDPVLRNGSAQHQSSLLLIHLSEKNNGDIAFCPFKVLLWG